MLQQQRAHSRHDRMPQDDRVTEAREACNVAVGQRGAVQK